MLPGPIKKASLYVLLAVMLLGTLWRGGYFPTQKWFLAVGLLAAGAIELAVVIADGTADARRRKALASPGLLLLSAFALYAILTRAWSVAPVETERESVLLLGYLATYFVIRSQLTRYGERALAGIAAWFIYAATFVSAWGLTAFLWRWSPYTGLVDDVWRAGSTFEYSNALSCMCLMALPVTFAVLRRSDTRDRPFLAVAACLQATGVIVSYARFGLVALVVLSIYMAFTGRQEEAAVNGRGEAAPAGTRGRFALTTVFMLAASIPIAVTATVAAEAKMPAVGLATALAILAAVFLIERYAEQPAFRDIFRIVMAAAAAVGLLAAALLASLSGRMREIISIRFSEGFSPVRLLPHRLDTWQGTVDALKVRPVTGTGLGSFAQVFTEHAIAVYTKYAHNLVLQTAVETGIIGAALLVFFLGYVMVLGMIRLIAKTDPLRRAFAITSLVFIIYNMFDWEWYVPALTAWFIVAAACTESVPGDREENPGGNTTEADATQ